MSQGHVRLSRFALALTGAVAACGGGGSTGPSLDQALTVVSAGIAHSCGLTAAGQAFCWGWNRDGQLGDGGNASRSSPVAVQGGLTFESIAAGGGHTCGVVVGGAAYCWGFNLNGQLGDGDEFQNARVDPGAVLGSIQFASIVAGASYNCGLATDGTAYCWGWNGEGQLGDGGVLDQSTPVQVGPGLTFTSLAVGAFHSCGVTASGDGYCWGRNSSGELGNGGQLASNVPVLVTGGLSFTSLAVGDEHTCAVVATGDVYCWGVNEFGQTATAGGGIVLTPTPIVGGPAFASVFARADFTCGLDATGAMFCWGINDLGQHGALSQQICTETDLTGVIVSQVGCAASPVPGVSDHRFGRLALGSHHVCAISLTEGVAFCWGDGGEGQLGDGMSGSLYNTIQAQRVLGQPGSGT
ncbi:MAG: hypothetical protein IID05_04725 [Gemmatimonadetes bacterium]|nr:hypothetical protein [Gemmatimonadota bacterium]